MRFCGVFLCVSLLVVMEFHRLKSVPLGSRDMPAMLDLGTIPGVASELRLQKAHSDESLCY